MIYNLKNKNIIVWFSCGAASAVAAYYTIKIFGKDNNVRIVNNPVANEHHDNLRFLKDVEKWLGVTIETAINKDYPSCNIEDVFEKRRYMSGVGGAPCTMLLKKEARYQFESNNSIDYHVLGFTIEEWKRQKRFNLQERGNTLPVLVSELITKEDCFRILKKHEIEIPEIYKIGLPNANCIGCVKSSSPTYWNLIRDKFPDVFNQRAKQSRDIGCKLVKLKGKRVFIDELPKDAKGGKIKTFDCSIFCDL